jgi:hypothetical protein
MAAYAQRLQIMFMALRGVNPNMSLGRCTDQLTASKRMSSWS